MTTRPKILWGVCGIGHGHTFRQMPLIDHFATQSDIVIFAYGNSLDILKKRYASHTNIHVAEVSVSFYIGSQAGLDFNASAQHLANEKLQNPLTNMHALALAEQHLGQPDLVISDYEPVSAQYAYAQDAPLVTLDQQSKYLVGDFPPRLHDQSHLDECARLRMFFPKATSRMACSFFNVTQRDTAKEIVSIHPPIISEIITKIQYTPRPEQKSVIVYMSEQQYFGQSAEDMIAICRSIPDCQFHFFGNFFAKQKSIVNVHIYPHGDPAFHKELAKCHGIISTAGHSLLSEAMYLGIPVYAIPLPLYEQQMNARVIGANQFGLSHTHIDRNTVINFVKNHAAYRNAINADKHILLRHNGYQEIICSLTAQLA